MIWQLPVYNTIANSLQAPIHPVQKILDKAMINLMELKQKAAIARELGLESSSEELEKTISDLKDDIKENIEFYKLKI